MLGVILCGGESSRMGRDKGMIAIRTTTWAGSAMEKMSSLDIPVVLSVNSRQNTDYLDVFDARYLISDNTELSVKGPLAGILSVHIQYPTDDLFVLACDMPYMKPELLTDLYGYAEKNSGFKAYLYTNNSEPEPLCGIYTAGGLEIILRLLRSGQLAKHSMKYTLERLTVALLAIPERKKQAFTNVNGPANQAG